MGAPSRLLIVGIDGADYALMSGWVAQGHLPNLARLIERGRLLPCASTHPPVTAPAWTTAFTGCNPGKHGLYDFWDFSFPDRVPWWALPRACPSIWKLISDAGLTCGALNTPMTFPAEPINGVLISGMGCPEMSPQAFFPRGLREQLLDAVPDYTFHPSQCGPVIYPDAEELAVLTRYRTEAAAWLLDNYQFDVFSVVFGSLDWAGHGYAREFEQGGTALKVAQMIDTQIGEILKLCDWPRTPVMVLSDHGMRCASRQANLYVLFQSLGLTRFRWEGARRGVGLRSALIRLWNLAKRVLPDEAMFWLRRKGHAQREAILASGPKSRIDWEHTIAAPVGPYGTVRLNIRGRDPFGIVPPDEYEATRHGIIQKLRAATDPATGKPLFGQVLSREEAYSGLSLDEAPDIVLADPAPHMAFGVAFDESDMTPFLDQSALVMPLVPPHGVHSSTGIMMISGDDAATGEFAGGCSLQDFTPTALHLLGVPTRSYMDGRVLSEHLAGEAALRRAEVLEEALPEPGPELATYTDEDEEEIREKLAALGYL